MKYGNYRILWFSVSKKSLLINLISDSGMTGTDFVRKRELFLFREYSLHLDSSIAVLIF